MRKRENEKVAKELGAKHIRIHKELIESWDLLYDADY